MVDPQLTFRITLIISAMRCLLNGGKFTAQNEISCWPKICIQFEGLKSIRDTLRPVNLDHSSRLLRYETQDGLSEIHTLTGPAIKCTDSFPT